MTSILLTGIPEVGKTGLINATAKILKKLKKKPIKTFCLSDIIAEEVFRLWRTPKERISYLDPCYQQLLRSYAISETACRLKDLKNDKHVIIDTPMTMFSNEGIIPDLIFEQEQIQKLHKAAKGLNYTVTLIDDVMEILSKLKNTPYPRKPNKILDWITSEINATRKLTPTYYKDDDGCKQVVRRLIIPKKHSETTLVKLLYDATPTAAYFAFPISHLKEIEADTYYEKNKKRKAKEKIAKFRDKMQEYCIMLVPMVMSDSRAKNRIEIINTVNRDLQYFVNQSDFVIAYFPFKKYKSEGVFQELRHNLRIGKLTILIHPSNKQNKEVFGFKPTLQYRNPEEFFETLENCNDSKYDNRPEAFLRKLLDKDLKKPRYEHLIIKEQELF